MKTIESIGEKKVDGMTRIIEKEKEEEEEGEKRRGKLISSGNSLRIVSPT